MFPSPNRDKKKSIYNLSPVVEHAQSNKLSHFPYFKRFPNNQFLSQERQRTNKY